tara:strand:+ start:61 stop:294 length:234 start_codon:yes stop_codon:yes gene_type:complete
MDQKKTEFNLLIETHKLKYANICLLWKNYIEIKQKTFEDHIMLAVEKLKKIETLLECDISMENLLLLTIVQELDINN